VAPPVWKFSTGLIKIDPFGGTFHLKVVFTFLMRQKSMIKQTKLAKAIAYAVAGAALTAGSISSASATVTTMYNLTKGGGVDNSTNTTDPTTSGSWALWGGATDGWNYNFNEMPAAKWAGTTTGAANDISTSLPFGYTGVHMNWGFEIANSNGGGGSGVISTYDAFNRYGVYADVDTARGAWSALNTGATFGGWRHDLDVGLFKSDTSGMVTLTATGIVETGNYGFTIFHGMDAVTDYNHHGQWNNNSWATAGNPYTGAIFSGTGLATSAIVARSYGDNGATPSVNESANLNTIQFYAQAGEYYTIFLGGYRNGNWGDTYAGYSLSVSQVPVPGALWLFGSAAAGLMGLQRRKRSAV